MDQKSSVQLNVESYCVIVLRPMNHKVLVLLNYLFSSSMNCLNSTPVINLSVFF